MEAIKCITDAKGLSTGLFIDLNSARKIMKKRKGLITLMEDIEDILAVELTKTDMAFNYQEARKRIFHNSQ